MTPDQLRMARALLRVNVAAFAEIAQVDKNTLINYELGRTAKLHARVQEQIETTLAEYGVIFLQGIEGLHQASVALRWEGADPEKLERLRNASPQKRDPKLGKARAWDEEDYLLDDDEIERMRHYWSNGARWARLSEAGRKALQKAIGEVGLDGLPLA